MSELNKAHLIVGYGKDRKENDAYFTPTYAIKALLKREKFDKSKSFCEPCVGKGRISETIKGMYGENVDIFSSDLYNYGYGDEIGIDLSRNYHVIHKKENWFSEKSFNYVITNPPYKEETFIPIVKNCLNMAKNKVALLLKLAHLCGKDRYIEKIFRDTEFPLARVYLFVQRLNFGIRSKKTGKKMSRLEGLKN